MDGDDFIRKSNRRKKTNVRLQILGDSDDSGDDFAPPPLKRKSEKLSPHMPSEEMKSPRSRRLPRDEKSFNRDIEKALAKSMIKLDTSLSVTQCDKQLSSSTQHQDEEEETKKNENSTDTSNFEPEVEDEYTDSDDDDFEITTNPHSKNSNRTAKRKPHRNTPYKGMDVGHPGADVIANPRHGDSVVEPPSLPLGTSVASGNNKSKPKWVPPAKIGDTKKDTTTRQSINLNGGGTPVIRVGLSRRAHIKPLHRQTKPK